MSPPPPPTASRKPSKQQSASTPRRKSNTSATAASCNTSCDNWPRSKPEDQPLPLFSTFNLGAPGLDSETWVSVIYSHSGFAGDPPLEPDSLSPGSSPYTRSFHPPPRP